MEEFKEFQHLKFPLEEILSATNNFDVKNRIGNGGFGYVYKGSLSHSKGQGIVACKRLIRELKYGQGETQFLKEITTLPRYTHENIISLLGFCNDGDERILIYEHASRGSLDRYLNSEALTWSQRLKICFEAAKGLRHLHDPSGTPEILIHCDIKSSNILLNENWNAKLADFGLSRFGPANQKSSFVISEIDGTHGYCDPVYMETNVLMKESDVYSFGVVLFEVLCGKVCSKMINDKIHSLVPTWMEMYKDEKLEQIIFEGIKEKMDQGSLKIFADIAYGCLNTSRGLRPTMDKVVTELEFALETQKISEGEELFDYEEMCRSAVPSLTYRSKAELNMLLAEGVLLNNGKTFFLVNKNGEHCEVISIADCLSQGPPTEYKSSSKSRFGVYCYIEDKFTVRVRTQFLTPMIAYKVNLLFKQNRGLDLRKQCFMKLKYKLPETKPSTLYLAHEGEDKWLRAELLMLISDRRSVDLEIMFSSDDYMKVQGIEFQPLEKVKVEVLEDEMGNGERAIDSDTYWEQKLPNDYQAIIELAKHWVPQTTMKDLYFSLCRGLLINNGDLWFSLSKNGKKCYMLPARSVLVATRFKLISEPESRFKKVARASLFSFSVGCKFDSQILSSQTTYAVYLVYKSPMVEGAFECRVEETMKDISKDEWGHENISYYVSLTRVQTPVIRLTKYDQDVDNLLNRPQMKYQPRLREDGFMEVQIWEFQTSATSEKISMQAKLKHCKSIKEMRSLIIHGSEMKSNQEMKDIIVQGIEIKPV